MMRRILFAVFLMLMPPAAQAADALNCSALRDIPVLHEGRLKPLDSFARIYLRQFSGRDNAAGLGACAWLAESLFDPAAAAQRRIFQIRNPELVYVLEIDPQQKYYALTDLEKGLAKTAPQIEILLQQNPAAWTPAQQDLLALHNHVAEYHEIMRSFTLLMPLALEVPQNIAPQLPAGELINFLTLQSIEPEARNKLAEIVQQKGSDPAGYDSEEQILAQLLFDLDALRAGGRNSAILRIMPAPFDAAEKWVSPWMMVERGQGSPENGVYLRLWQDMAKAYRDHDEAAWQAAQKNALETIQKRSMSSADIARLQLENFYNRFRFYERAIMLYALSLAMLWLAARKDNPRWLQKVAPQRSLRLLGYGFFSLAVLCHAAGILLRMIILARPPVGTLYESLLFVGLICALTGLLLFWRTKNKLPLTAGALAAAGLLLAAPNLLQQGESLELLTAVLNTNFWLGTHVLTIATGYGLCVMAALFAHVALARRIVHKMPDTALENVVYKISLAALLFCTVGTILGGIWADQSWGRFWGWDPKENGALLIVLWLLWAQHGRLSAHLTPRAFLAAIAFLNVIVALAWFGVNLMGVGLHSYGFITGIAAALGLFCAAEIVIIAFLWVLAAKPRARIS